MKRIIIIPKNKSKSILKKYINPDFLCYFLSDDYNFFIDLKYIFENKVKIRNLSGLFDETCQEIKDSYLELSAALNKRYGSRQWWSTQIASRSNGATPLRRNVIYLFCVKRILADADNNVIFIIDSVALSHCISEIAKEAGCQVVCSFSSVSVSLGVVRRWVYNMGIGAYYILQMIQHRYASLKLLKPISTRKLTEKKRVVLRSWVTDSSFNKHGKYKDRNFGSLPAWLRTKNYEVWILPMFFNLTLKKRLLYTLLRNQKQHFVFPYHYVTFWDYFRSVCECYKMLLWRIEFAEIDGTNVAPLFNEVISQHLHEPEVSFVFLQRLKDVGFQVDAFCYPFEGNQPEKPFILACREYFPDSKVIGLQHTYFAENVLTIHLASGESEFHPLPDKIICSGPNYVGLFSKAGFPSEILTAGPNLRHKAVYGSKSNWRKILSNGEKAVLLPLTYSYALAFDLFLKVKEALKNTSNYKVYIRNHPLLAKKEILKFLRKIGMTDFTFADDGSIQEWFPKLTAVISEGSSITILEAVVAGVPVIRVIPDNSIFEDPLHCPEYPLEPTNSAMKIKKQLEVIEDITFQNGDFFLSIGKDVIQQYFTEPTEENMKVFI